MRDDMDEKEHQTFKVQGLLTCCKALLDGDLQLSFVFFFRSCGVVCEAFYSSKNAQGSGRGRPRKLRGRVSFAEGCGRGCW